ncbi:hypothetical protein ACQKWADRAFT_297112 [Trichoderma austrokoningii]
MVRSLMLAIELFTFVTGQLSRIDGRVNLLQSYPGLVSTYLSNTSLRWYPFGHSEPHRRRPLFPVWWIGNRSCSEHYWKIVNVL